MKKSLVWAVALGVVLTLNSCGSDDPDPVPAIVGTWARAEYEFTELPTGFTKYWEGYTATSWQETGYAIVFNADGTYKRNFTLPEQFNLTDQGTWKLEGTSLKLSPDDTGDIDLIETLESDYLIFPGIEFSVAGEITSVRMELTRVITLPLPSDAAIDNTPDGENIPDDEYKAVDVTVVYKFDKLSK